VFVLVRMTVNAPHARALLVRIIRTGESTGIRRMNVNTASVLTEQAADYEKLAHHRTSRLILASTAALMKSRIRFTCISTSRSLRPTNDEIRSRTEQPARHHS